MVGLFSFRSPCVCPPALVFIHVAADTVPNRFKLRATYDATLGVIFLQSPSPLVRLAKRGTTLPDPVGPIRVTS